MRPRHTLHFLGILLVLAPIAGISKELPKADLNLKDTEGNRVRLRDYRGKIVVLNFWATWCGPCKAELPLLVEAEKEYGPRGVAFVEASLDEPKNTTSTVAYLNAHHVKFPAWIGATAEDMDKLGMGPAVPATAFLDREGHIVARILGQMREQELKERLDWLTGSRLEGPPEAIVKHLGE